MKKKILFTITLLIFAQAQSYDIFQAIDENNYKEAQKILNKNPAAAITTRNLNQKYGIQTPLLHAINKYKGASIKGKYKKEAKTNLQIIKLLLQTGANPDEKTPWGKYIIEILASHDLNVARVKLFLTFTSNRIIINKTLYKACKSKAINIIQLLLQHKANPQTCDTFMASNCPQALFWSFTNPKKILPAMKLLIKYGANINMLNINGQSTFHKALADLDRYSSLELTKLLLQKGAQVNQICKNPNILVEQNVAYRPIDLVLQAKCFVGRRPDFGHYFNPHDLQTNNKRYKIMKLLLQNGACINHIDSIYIHNWQHTMTPEMITNLKIYVEHRDTLAQHIRLLSESMLGNNIPNAQYAINEIKKMMRNSYVPAYDKIQALSYLAFIQRYDNIYCFSEGNLKKLLRQIPFNHDFFNDDACIILRNMAFGLKGNVIDINGATIEEAICNFPEYISVLVTRKRNLFFAPRWYGDNNISKKISPLTKKLLFDHFALEASKKPSMRLTEKDLADPLIQRLHEKINGPINKETNTFRNRFINYITSASLILFAPQKPDDSILPEVPHMPDELLFKIFSYKKEEVCSKTYLPPKELMPAYYASNKKARNKKRKRTEEPNEFEKTTKRRKKKI